MEVFLQNKLTMNWHEIYKTDLIDENLVSGIHLVELFEKDSIYHSISRNYFSRLKESLGYLPEEFQDAALAVFSNVVYIPKQLLDQTYKYFWRDFLSVNEIDNIDNHAIRICHFFEIDPSGMINSFCHENAISQRLHPDYFVRISDVKNAKETCICLMHSIKEIVDDAKNSLKRLFQKDHWIIFTDKALSGQSLFKDIERYIFLRELAYKSCGFKPKITIFAQIITEDALKYGKDLLENEDKISLKYGIILNDVMKVNSDNCKLFKNRSMIIKVRELCEWFAQNILDHDTKNYDRMREKSGDNLAYGYKGCGLTLVDHSNCPTNSLPLLWYDNLYYCDQNNLKPYQGPFPRVHSRTGPQNNEPTENGWNLIFQNEDKLIHILKT